MNISLAGKLALVTGAGAGIGRGCALELARSGADVIVNDIDPASGERTAEQIRQLGRQAWFVRADVSSDSEVTAMAKAVSAHSDKLHILVNNAGLNMFKGIVDTTPEDWDRIMGVDLKGLYLVTRSLLPLLRSAGGASVINIASVHAQATVPHLTAYAAAKGGVVAMVRSLAQELGPMRIRVNAVSPGFVDTPLMDRWLASVPDREQTMRYVLSFHPLGRIGTPQDIGRLVVFLGSEMSGFITGTNITIDGGLTAQLKH
ncbi:SDR family NAD(P)-dependent oxidoreductase [Fontivita pretiosa]|uniref:SDR family NAD(P)-dependent oxidoreductase n=1 Tax=Fontivita pretiosa TaxID=2989684 RepID=UPI003D18315F